MTTSNATLKFYAPCQRCGAETPHSLVGECRKVSSINDHGVQIDFCETYSLIQCNICEQARLRRVFWNSENEASPPEYFPPGRRRRPPVWVDELDEKYKSLLQEVYAAYDSGYMATALMGARAALDIWVSTQTSNSNGFNAKLSKLKQAGTLSSRQIELLEPTFNAASGAAHRGYKPNEADALTVIEAVENVLQQDSLAPRIEQLKKNTPPRE
jgi:hypothetical protein